MGRVETGRYQFGDDWPGVFIRGDEALNFAGKLRAFSRLSVAAQRIVLAELIDLLGSCEVIDAATDSVGEVDEDWFI